jgi:hypothetical protein
VVGCSAGSSDGLAPLRSASEARRIADQPAVDNEIALIVDRRDGIARRQRNQRSTLAGEKWTSAEQERSGAGLLDRPERGFDFVLVCGFHNYDLPSERATCCHHVGKLQVEAGIVRISEHGDDGRGRNKIAQQL